MSLYDGINVNMGKKKEDSAKGWTHAGMKLLQSQIQLKKASLTQRDKLKGVPAASPSVAPVVDLRSRGGDGKPLNFAPPEGLDPKPNLNRNRKPNMILDGPPLSFMNIGPKDEKVMIFGEIAVEDEYNPLHPNDYNKVVVRREAERKVQRDADRKKDVEERERRRQEKREREIEEEEEREHKKRIAGAAIAPPTSLIENDKKLLEAPAPKPSSFKPDFGDSGKGLGFAARIMEKYGYKQGEGLGKSAQGMTRALEVEKTSNRGGRIIHEKDVKEEEPEMPPPSFIPPAPPAAKDPPPITEVLRNPTKVVLLRNMAARGDVDPELEMEVREEMVKYGELIKCLIYEMPPPTAEDEAVRIFLEFGKVDFAIKAVVDLNGRYFGGRLVRASFYDIDKFHRFELNSD